MNLLVNLFLISYAASYLTNYPGAQQTAMGGAFCGIADNAYANFYNPAGLAFQNEVDLSFEHNSLKGIQVKYWRFAGVLPLTKYSSLGIFGTGIYDRWVVLDFEGRDTIGTAKINDFTSGLAFDYELLNFIGTGIVIKYIQNHLSSKTTSYNDWVIGRTFAVDIGFLIKYPSPLGKFGFGFTGQHIGPSMSYSANFPISGEKDPLPITIRGGISYVLTAKELLNNNSKSWFSEWAFEKWRLIIAYDINKVKDEKLWHSFGFELRPIPILALRLGYFSAPEPDDYAGRKGWTSGLGIDLKFLRFDIANDDAFYRYGFTPSHLSFTLSLNLGEPIFPKNGILGKR